MWCFVGLILAVTQKKPGEEILSMFQDMITDVRTTEENTRKVKGQIEDLERRRNTDAVPSDTTNNSTRDRFLFKKAISRLHRDPEAVNLKLVSFEAAAVAKKQSMLDALTSRIYRYLPVREAGVRAGDEFKGPGGEFLFRSDKKARAATLVLSPFTESPCTVKRFMLSFWLDGLVSHTTPIIKMGKESTTDVTIQLNASVWFRDVKMTVFGTRERICLPEFQLYDFPVVLDK